jgi:hypothetical protein
MKEVLEVEIKKLEIKVDSDETIDGILYSAILKRVKEDLKKAEGLLSIQSA